MTTTERPSIPEIEVPPEPWQDRAARQVRLRARRARKALPRYRAHAWRLLKLLLTLMFRYSWVGAWRTVKLTSQWLYDYQSASLQFEHSGRGETKEWAAVDLRRSKRLRARRWAVGATTIPVLFLLAAWFVPTYLAWTVAAVVFVCITKAIPGKDISEFFIAAAVGGVVGWAGMVWYPRIPEPDWTDWRTLTVLSVLAVAALVALGLVGRPEDKPLLKPTTLGANVLPKPTAPMVTAALCSLGNSKMKEPDSIGLIIDGARNGPGWNFHFLLPQGVTATWVMDHREELAGAMRFPLGTVWPSVGLRNPAHLVLDVTDEDLKDADQEPWPLLRATRVDLSKALPQTTDQRGDWVEITLAYANVIIGAVPRVGKTFFLRQLLMTAGLDPAAKVYAIDGKGTGDLSPTQLFAHRYVRGVRSTRPELIEKVRAMVGELRVEMDRRADVIDSLSHDECPESKVTGDLIRNRPDLKLGWIVVGIDETQMLFGYGDKSNPEHRKIRDELRAGITELVKLGPALGIIVILATQDVVEETIPTQISRMAVIRFCMKVEDYQPNDRVLGTGAYKRGLDATMFDIEDKGIGYLKAEGGVPRIVRTVHGLDKPACEPLAVRARALRVQAGTLTGDAVDDEMVVEAEQITLLEDVRHVFEDDGALTLDDIREGLELLRPALYGPWDNTTLGEALNDAGVRRATVYSTRSKVKARGVKREWLDVSATENVTGDEAEQDDAEVIEMPQR